MKKLTKTTTKLYAEAIKVQLRQTGGYEGSWAKEHGITQIGMINFEACRRETKAIDSAVRSL